jgi:hypothetical protein
MSILKNTEKDYFVHYNQLVQFIAEDLKVSPKKVQLITHKKHIDDSNVKFDKLTAIIKENKHLESKYDVTKTQIKQLLAQHLNIELAHINCDYVCNVKPGGNGIAELNYINVIDKSPKLSDTLDRIKKLRVKSTDKKISRKTACA